MIYGSLQPIYLESFPSQFFFLSVNENSIEKRQKGRTKVHTMYTTAAKKRQKKEEKTKNYSLPQIDPNQSMKSWNLPFILLQNLKPLCCMFPDFSFWKGVIWDL